MMERTPEQVEQYKRYGFVLMRLIAIFVVVFLFCTIGLMGVGVIYLTALLNTMFHWGVW